MLFSIIIPVYEQWHLIPALLECLQNQSISQSACEILFVDNGSKGFMPPEDLPVNVSVLHCPRPGSYAARNHGANRAHGQWLVFTDADCLPEPEWLENLARAAHACGARTILAGSVRMFSSSVHPSPWEMYDLVKGIPQEWYVRRGTATTANLAVHRDLFAMLGGFDPERYSGGDADFCKRAVAKHARIVYVSAAQVNHPARTTWKAIRTKARRIRGGHLTSGPMAQRIRWGLRTLVPPLPESIRLIRSNAHPIRFRFWAVLVQWRIWLTDIFEMVRIGLGKMPERR